MDRERDYVYVGYAHRLSDRGGRNVPLSVGGLGRRRHHSCPSADDASGFFLPAADGDAVPRRRSAKPKQGRLFDPRSVRRIFSVPRGEQLQLLLRVRCRRRASAVVAAAPPPEPSSVLECYPLEVVVYRYTRVAPGRDELNRV